MCSGPDGGNPMAKLEIPPVSRQMLKEIRSLTQKKFRDGLGLFMVEGLRLTQEAAGSHFDIVRVLHLADFASDPAGARLLEALRMKCHAIHQVTPREMDQVAETVTSQGILAVVRQRRESVSALIARREPGAIVVALDSISDPGNLGTIIRTCDWFGVDGVLVGRNSVDLYNPKVVRASMGGVFHVRVVDDVDLLSALSQAKSAGFAVYVTDTNGESHFDRTNYSRKSIIVFGSEAWGISDQIRELADVRVAIRRYGGAESLNVAVAGGIVLSGVHRLDQE
jgi:TrmH family RNA methyltransferase